MFEDFLNNTKIWLTEAEGSDIVISSRIRLARNIDTFPFSLRASSAQRQEILDRLKGIYTQLSALGDAIFVEMDGLDEIDKYFLIERHLMSQEHLSGDHKGMIVTRDESIAVMLNEEDHLRIQIIKGGFNLQEAWSIINALDDELSQQLPLAYVADIGYLTACPTNTGTGLRASCMLHLPALVLTKKINRVLELMAKLSFTARGIFGEGTQALGNFFQVSNQVSLGMQEQELIDNLSGIVRQIQDQEVASREVLLRRYRPSLEDNVWRAWGILSNCRLINSNETFSHLSMLRLGVDLGIIKGIRKRDISELFIMTQPAHLQKMEQKTLKEGERDHMRASILRERLRRSDVQ